MRFDLLLPLCLLSAAPAPSAKNSVDVSALRDKLVALGDGQGRFLVVAKDGDLDAPAFWGTAEALSELMTIGGGKNGEDFDRVFWDPRISSGWQRAFGRKEGRYFVQCADRKTELAPIPEEEQKALFEKAAFQRPRWKRRAHSLARDNKGVYYYVDASRAEGQKDFRLFVGPRGGLKLMKMINVVSDSAGDIFATRSGELRLVLNTNESLWVSGKKENKLTRLPIEDNAQLIYGDLGVYEKEKLGTPCDEL